MQEVRKKDVLRLFFGSEYKHYLVEKVGKQSLKLKNEEGVQTRLAHDNGKIDMLGDAKITGVEVLRDPKRYADYLVGSEVAVTTFDGKAFKGDIVENDDGMLKVKTDKNELYVDLDNSKNRVELVANSVTNESEVIKLPDEIDDLFFLTLKKDASSHSFNATTKEKTVTARQRIYQYYRQPTVERPLPFWIVPVLDNHKCKIDLVAENDVYGSDPLRILSFTSGKSIKEKTEAVLFNQTVYLDRVKESYVYVGLGNENLPVAEYALMVPLTENVPFNNQNPYYGARVSQPKVDAKRYDTVENAVDAYTPNIASAACLFDAEIQLYPLALKPTVVIHRVQESKKTTTADGSLRPTKKSRSSLAASYNGLISENLTASETLFRMLATDYGNTYFSKNTTVPVNVEKNWALEKIGQRLKHNPLASYPKEAIAIVNKLFSCLHNERYSEFLALLQEHGRIAAEKENKNYVYFSAPVFSNYKLIPCSAERVARIFFCRGKTGIVSILQDLVSEDGFKIDRKTGFIFFKEPEQQEKVTCETTDVDCFLQSVPTYSENDLMVLNLAHRVATQLMLQISQENEVSLLNVVRLYSEEPYKVACTVAAFLAHNSNIPFSAAAEALRKVAKRKFWASVQESKELSADILKAAQKFEPKKKKKSNATPVSFAPKASEDVAVPLFEHVHPVFSPSQHASKETVYTVLSNAAANDYSFLSDVFAPDGTAILVIERCTPIIMQLLAPSEKSFFQHLGDPQNNRHLYEFVSNISCVVPTLLIQRRRNFDDKVSPAGKKPQLSFKTVWTQYYASLLTIEVDSEVTDRFATIYKQRAKAFQRLVSVAKTALLKEDDLMLRACVVRAVYIHLSDDMSEEMEAYILQMVRACISMYRHQTL